MAGTEGITFTPEQMALVEQMIDRGVHQRLEEIGASPKGKKKEPPTFPVDTATIYRTDGTPVVVNIRDAPALLKEPGFVEKAPAGASKGK